MSDQHALYARFGFNAIGEVEHRGEVVTVMALDLKAGRREVFSIDCQKAFELGARLARGSE